MEMHPTAQLIIQLHDESVILLRWHKAHFFLYCGSIFCFVAATIDIIIIISFDFGSSENFSLVAMLISFVCLFGGMFSRRAIKRHEIKFAKILDEINNITIEVIKND